MTWPGAFRCNRCLHIWTAPAGAQACPQCRFYSSIAWLNFLKLRADHPWHGVYPPRRRYDL